MSRTAMMQCSPSHWLWDVYFQFRVWTIPLCDDVRGQHEHNGTFLHLGGYFCVVRFWVVLITHCDLLLFNLICDTNYAIHYQSLFSFFFEHSYRYRHWIFWIETVLIQVIVWWLSVVAPFDWTCQSSHGLTGTRVFIFWHTQTTPDFFVFYFQFSF